MIPLTTIQGLEPHDLRARIAGRPIYIWGSGPLAQDVETSLHKSALSVRGRMDSRDADLQSKLAQKPFVILATTTWRKQAADILKEAVGVEFITHMDIRRPQAVIEITTARHASPYHRDPPPLQPDYMSVEDFARVVDKLQRDMPQLVRIVLSYFGDPLLHPDLARMIAIAEAVAPVSMTMHGQTPYMMPYDGMLAQETLDVELPYDLGRALELAKADKALPCLSQRVFPIILPNLSVALCHLYNPLILQENYLTSDWARLLQIRSNMAHCNKCQAEGLHRLDIDVLRRRHEGAL